MRQRPGRSARRGFLSGGAAHANPQGGTVAAGEAAISAPDADTVVIDQTSDRVVIDWTGFDIDTGETTRFNQPGSNSVALNRVTMGGASSILGNLEANGMVFLINPAGIVFGPGSSVDVHGLVATTSDIANQSFMDGDYSFTVPSNDPGAEVVNQGTITVGEAGLAAVDVPVMVMGGTADTGTPWDWGAQLAFDHVGSAERALVGLEGAEHMIATATCDDMPFTDMIPESFRSYVCEDPAWDKSEALAVTNELTTAWLRHVLDGERAARRVLEPLRYANHDQLIVLRTGG